jgi:pyrimidine/purine-5'-nucleotide nucleosidase
MDTVQTIDTEVRPRGSLEMLSHAEIEMLSRADSEGYYDLFRRCSLAVLNAGSDIDDAEALFARYAEYGIQIVQRARGIKLQIRQAPASAFVDGEMIRGIREHLFAVLRDLVYIKADIEGNRRFAPETAGGATDAVFHILRNAGVLKTGRQPDLVVCWGGHSIGREEYDYTKEVGYQLGLRGLHICTGCGPGAMKGPMKGAAIGHAKQRLRDGRYVGLSEPGIIAAEPPNAIVNRLVVMPDIEKRLEAFVRAGYGIVIFPGGVGTTEEILYLLGILMHPQNHQQNLPVVLTGPAASADYFSRVDALVGMVLGDQARQLYRIILDDPAEVARHMMQGAAKVKRQRRRTDDAFYFNWLLHVPPEFQRPFEPTHENMAGLRLHRDVEPHVLAADLRRAFSGIVAGNVKAEGIAAIRRHGPFEISGDSQILGPVDELLRAFAEQGRMKLSGEYKPCYRVVL